MAPRNRLDVPDAGRVTAAQTHVGAPAARATLDGYDRTSPNSLLEIEDEQDRTGVDRWINEGGRVASGLTERSMSVPPAGRRSGCSRVLIVGGGVAGLETLLALRALAAHRVEVTILAPELTFVNRSMAAGQPFERPRFRGLRLQDIADEHRARWHRGAIDRVEHRQRRVITKDGDELGYDMLVLAIGARPGREWQSDGVLTFHGRRNDGQNCYPVLLHQLREGHIKNLAFVKQAGASWLLPLYDLALMTAADCVAHERFDVKLSLVTPEPEPLAIFGTSASAAIRRLMNERAITTRTGSYGVPRGRGWLDIFPDGGMPVDRVVTVPGLVGPCLRGIPCGGDGFIHTDAHGRLAGIDGVFAAGDATTFPIKQGGLAAQQADAVAQMIAFSAGVDIDPQPFRPILRGVLLTGGTPRYLRADISGLADDDCAISETALWWPPNKLCARYLAPYLSSQIGGGADVMPQDDHATPAATALDFPARRSHELSDLHPLQRSRS